eukprot:TRINITY_DN1821_c3_g1_i1.p1 TRINITY_DN1821_c3_g1~~TRINITY_DN1821_c3_g1_i1.p1  ORF type:complete len:645 (-),score=289.85 TRINITY_DN1821_c3_g1_i1:119-2053(-)
MSNSNDDPVQILEETEEESVNLGNFSCGVDWSFVPDLERALQLSTEANFDFLAVPLAHPRYERRVGLPSNVIGSDTEEPFTRSDLLLNSAQWSSLIVGKTSPWIKLDSNNPIIRRHSLAALKQEFAWASHLNLPAILLPTPNINCINYAQAINQLITSVTSMQIWIRLTLNDDSWQIWNKIRCLVEHNSCLFVVLELGSNIPEQSIINRWKGEPLKAIIIPTSIFLKNKMGYPTLPKRYQTLMNQFFKFSKIQYLIKVKGAPDTNVNNRFLKGGLISYLQYLRYLWRNQEPLSQIEIFERPYYDYLQCPLQPLMDNLESQTYEVFERDPVKYERYEQAIYEALIDLNENTQKLKTEQQQLKISDKHKSNHIILMVVGAGRGPLVKASLAASIRANVPLRIYAIEKNPNAVVTLRNMKIQLDWQNVTIFDADMRTWNAPEKADILVSELLGSFADNELSPECLDGAQSFLKPNGISIPCEYSSFIAPITCPKVWNDVKAFGDLKHFETPYVVRFFNSYQLTQAKKCFTFIHPNYDQIRTNSRFIQLQFQINHSSLVHGFIGFFDATLYKDVHISIYPQTFSIGMFSWFPIYFPIRNPIYVDQNQIIDLNMWRCCTNQKVWYEWAITQPITTPIHNPNGRSYWIGL